MLGCAALMAAAPWLNLAPARKALPDAQSLFGYVYQLIARTFAALEVDRLAAALLLVVCVWLCRRFLFHKPAGTGVGEYGLCAFFSLMTLLCTAARTQDTVAVLWENAFQVCKAGLFFAGMYLIFLMLLRALRKGLEKGRQAGPPLKPFRLEGIRYLLAAVCGDRGGVAAADLDPLPGRAHVGQLHADQAVHGRGGAHL